MTKFPKENNDRRKWSQPRITDLLCDASRREAFRALPHVLPVRRSSKSEGGSGNSDGLDHILVSRPSL